MKSLKLKAGGTAQKLSEEWGLTEDEPTTARVQVYYRRYAIILAATLTAYYAIFNVSGLLLWATQMVSWPVATRHLLSYINGKSGNSARDLTVVKQAIRNKRKSNRPPRRLFGFLPPKKPDI